MKRGGTNRTKELFAHLVEYCAGRDGDVPLKGTFRRYSNLVQLLKELNVKRGRIGRDLPIDEFIDVLVRSTLAERRPIDDRATIKNMLVNADVIITARYNGLLVGVSRAITDRAFCTYLSDLAVDQNFQRQGIGKQLIDRTHVAAGLATTLILLSAPKAVTYYPHIGMTQHNSCWMRPKTRCAGRE